MKSRFGVQFLQSEGRFYEAVCVRLRGAGGSLSGSAVVYTLSAEDVHTYSTFEEHEVVKPVSRLVDFADGDSLTLPAASVTSVVIRPSVS